MAGPTPSYTNPSTAAPKINKTYVAQKTTTDSNPEKDNPEKDKTTQKRTTTQKRNNNPAKTPVPRGF